MQRIWKQVRGPFSKNAFQVVVIFLIRNIFCGNLNEVILLIEIDYKFIIIWFPRKIFLKRTGSFSTNFFWSIKARLRERRQNRTFWTKIFKTWFIHEHTPTYLNQQNNAVEPFEMTNKKYKKTIRDKNFMKTLVEEFHIRETFQGVGHKVFSFT